MNNIVDIEAKYSVPHLLWHSEKDPQIQSVVSTIVSKLAANLKNGSEGLESELQMLINFSHSHRLRKLVWGFADVSQLVENIICILLSSATDSMSRDLLVLTFLLTFRAKLAQLKQWDDLLNYLINQILRSSVSNPDLHIVLGVVANLLRKNPTSQAYLKSHPEYQKLKMLIYDKGTGGSSDVKSKLFAIQILLHLEVSDNSRASVLFSHTKLEEMVKWILDTILQCGARLCVVGSLLLMEIARDLIDDLLEAIPNVERYISGLYEMSSIAEEEKELREQDQHNLKNLHNVNPPKNPKRSESNHKGHHSPRNPNAPRRSSSPTGHNSMRKPSLSPQTRFKSAGRDGGSRSASPSGMAVLNGTGALGRAPPGGGNRSRLADRLTGSRSPGQTRANSSMSKNSTGSRMNSATNSSSKADCNGDGTAKPSPQPSPTRSRSRTPIRNYRLEDDDQILQRRLDGDNPSRLEQGQSRLDEIQSNLDKQSKAETQQHITQQTLLRALPSPIRRVKPADYCKQFVECLLTHQHTDDVCACLLDIILNVFCARCVSVRKCMLRRSDLLPKHMTTIAEMAMRMHPLVSERAMGLFTVSIKEGVRVLESCVRPLILHIVRMTHKSVASCQLLFLMIPTSRFAWDSCIDEYDLFFQNARSAISQRDFALFAAIMELGLAMDQSEDAAEQLDVKSLKMKDRAFMKLLKEPGTTDLVQRVLFSSTSSDEIVGVLQLLSKIIFTIGDTKLFLVAERIAQTNQNVYNLRNRPVVEPEAMKLLEMELAKTHAEKEHSEITVQKKNDTLRELNHVLHSCTRELTKHSETLGELKFAKEELEDQQASKSDMKKTIEELRKELRDKDNIVRQMENQYKNIEFQLNFRLERFLREKQEDALVIEDLKKKLRGAYADNEVLNTEKKLVIDENAYLQDSCKRISKELVQKQRTETRKQLDFALQKRQREWDTMKRIAGSTVKHLQDLRPKSAVNWSGNDSFLFYPVDPEAAMARAREQQEQALASTREAALRKLSPTRSLSTSPKRKNGSPIRKGQGGSPCTKEMHISPAEKFIPAARWQPSGKFQTPCEAPNVQHKSASQRHDSFSERGAFERPNAWQVERPLRVAPHNAAAMTASAQAKIDHTAIAHQQTNNQASDLAGQIQRRLNSGNVSCATRPLSRSISAGSAGRRRAGSINHSGIRSRSSSKGGSTSPKKRKPAWVNPIPWSYEVKTKLGEGPSRNAVRQKASGIAPPRVKSKDSRSNSKHSPIKRKKSS